MNHNIPSNTEMEHHEHHEHHHHHVLNHELVDFLKTSKVARYLVNQLTIDFLGLNLHDEGQLAENLKRRKSIKNERGDREDSNMHLNGQQRSNENSMRLDPKRDNAVGLNNLRRRRVLQRGWIAWTTQLEYHT